MDDGKYRVVVVEDENLIARNIAKHIESENPGFKVVGIYSNGEDALEAIKKQPPSVVFTDISMPVMNGLELAAKIHETMKFIKCVIITGYAEFDYVKEALHYNVEDYLLKPVDPGELKKLLKKIEVSLTDISEDGCTGEKDTALNPEEIVALVKEYIEKNYKEDLDLNTIAQNLGFSSSYLTKVFNKVENVTPSKYIRNYRMNIAKQLLNDDEYTIAMVASAVGYNDPFHFSKSFKLAIGISPKEYRESLRVTF